MSTQGHGFVPIVHAATSTRPDEADTIETADAVMAALTRLGYESEIIALDLDVSPLQALAGRNPLAVFNLVEAMRGDDRLIAIAPAVLEHFGLSFTGGGSQAFSATMSKLRTKQLLRAAGLPTPMASADGTCCERAAQFIIKADTQHGSVGMDAASVVSGGDCAAEIKARSDRYRTRFFAEQFIQGREFNVALVADGNAVRVLPIQEITFEEFADDQPRIVDYAAKWDPTSLAYHTTPRSFGIEGDEQQLADHLTTIARGTWHALGLTGYARVDFRVSQDGVPYVLEVNVNPAISPDAGLAAAAAEAGLDYDALVGIIVDEAVNRAAFGLSVARHHHAQNT